MNIKPQIKLTNFVKKYMKLKNLKYSVININRKV